MQSEVARAVESSRLESPGGPPPLSPEDSLLDDAHSSTELDAVDSLTGVGGEVGTAPSWPAAAAAAVGQQQWGPVSPGPVSPPQPPRATPFSDSSASVPVAGGSPQLDHLRRSLADKNRELLALRAALLDPPPSGPSAPGGGGGRWAASTPDRLTSPPTNGVAAGFSRSATLRPPRSAPAEPPRSGAASNHYAPQHGQVPPLTAASPAGALVGPPAAALSARSLANSTSQRSWASSSGQVLDERITSLAARIDSLAGALQTQTPGGGPQPASGRDVASAPLPDMRPAAEPAWAPSSQRLDGRISSLEERIGSLGSTLQPAGHGYHDEDSRSVIDTFLCDDGTPPRKTLF